MILFFLSPLAGQHQIEIDSVVGPSRDAIRIEYSGHNGVQINSSGNIGVNVGSTGATGVRVGSTAFSGLYVDNAGTFGVRVGSAGLSGLYVDNAGANGVYVNYAAGDGILVNRAQGYSMNIQGSRNLSTGQPSSHIAQIYNYDSGTSPDVLALKVGTTSNPTGASNFITFYKGGDVAIGRIEGNGSGGVLYGTSGADFAECLPMISGDEQIEAGDIVGVYEGKISLKTEVATAVMVITDRPAVLGNQKEDSSSDEKVSFIGQVPVKVRGKVKAGDWIVASGHEDGTAIAISPLHITLDHQIVGRAWETNENNAVKKIMTAIGLDHSEAKDSIIEKMGDKLIAQQASIDNLQTQIDELKRLISKD
jgi:hypothetical protein